MVNRLNDFWRQNVFWRKALGDHTQGSRLRLAFCLRPIENRPQVDYRLRYRGEM
jgi:hypothetical protein